MKDSIYTIPISEVFEPMCGCPLCALGSTLEERWVEYITGAAMMEPDVRIETNRRGFCARHFEMMLGQRNRLSVALILQTRLAWIAENPDTPQKQPAFFKKETRQEEDSCFVCDRVNGELRRIGSNIASVWDRDGEFRELYDKQEFLCYYHAKRLIESASGSLKGARLAEFTAATNTLTLKKLKTVKENIDAFCNLFDYRNAGSPQPEPEIAAAVEHAIAYLTGSVGRDSEGGNK